MFLKYAHFHRSFKRYIEQTTPMIITLILPIIVLLSVITLL